MKRILIVDDSRVNLAFVNQILEDEYEIIQSMSAMKAINILQKEEIDLVLLDIQMPEMDGISAIKIIKSIDKIKDIPVIFLTGVNSSDTEIECLNCGAVDFITKPFVPEIVKLRIERTFELEDYHKRIDDAIENRINKANRVNDKLIRKMAEIIRDGNLDKKLDFNFDDVMGAFLEEIQKIGLYKNKINENVIFALKNYGMLYDIGKTRTAEKLLLKDSLNDSESEKMKIYIEKEKELVKYIFGEEEYFPEILDFMMYHHENWNGTGYPDGKKKTEIPLGARITAIVGDYIELREEKTYRKAYNHEQAIEIIKDGKEKRFDPMLMGIFCDVIGKCRAK